MTDGIKYHDNLADAWSAGYRTGSFKRRYSFLASHLRSVVQPGARWLDAGCGSGVLSIQLARLGAKVEAVDASSRMVDAAKRESKLASVDVDYRVVGSIEKLVSPDASFDGILCSSVVEYLSNPELALAEFSRVLVPGGYLIMTAPNRHSLVRNMQKIARAFYSILGMNRYSYLGVSKNDYTRSGLRQALRGAGLETVNLDVFDPILPSLLGRTTFGSLLMVTARRASTTDNSTVSVQKTREFVPY